MDKWSIRQLIVVFNFNQIIEIGEMAQDIKSEIYSRFTGIKLTPPQTYGNLKIGGYAYDLQSDKETFHIDFAPEGMNIIKTYNVAESAIKAKGNISAFIEDVRYVWEKFNNIAKLKSITKSGFVIQYSTTEKEPKNKPNIDGWDGYFVANRIFKQNDIKLTDGTIVKTIDNIFYDYENSPKTMMPENSIVMIDISIVPASGGIVNDRQISELLSKLADHQNACIEKAFNVR